MKKRLLCFALGLALGLSLCLTPALAAVEDKFPSHNSYPGYADVKESDWFYSNAKLCYEVGLMNGTDNGFAPEAVLPISQCAVVAARMREALTGETIPMPPDGEVSWPWYADYIRYLENVAGSDPSLNYALPILATPESPASRQDFLYLLNLATAGESFPALNHITSLPDTTDDLVLRFYNVGILTGVDPYGTFNASGTLTRAECAAMVSRVIRPGLRKSFTPQEKPAETTPAIDPEDVPAPSTVLTGTTDNTVAMTVNGVPILADELKMWVGSFAYQTDRNMYTFEGTRLDTSDPEMKENLLDHARDQIYTQIFAQEMQEKLGCTFDELPAKALPTIPTADLRAYIDANGLLCAKHILVSDIESANAVLNGLKAVPTLDQFNALLTVFGTDPGMASNPDGYLFTDGEMVAEFENAAKALAIGTYTTEPVKSEYGYHIIWRLDPTNHPGLIEEYRNYHMSNLLNDWIKAAQIVENEQVFSQLDLAECYNTYVKYMTYLDSVMGK